MESLLYIVLHMSILWLPHNRADTDIQYILQKMFECSSDGSGEPTVGHGKQDNSYDRRYTRGYKWDNGDIQEWLTTMMDYLSPSVGSKITSEDSENTWSPEHVDKFWSKLLKRELEVGDRFETLPSNLQRSASRVFLGERNAATGTAPRSGFQAKRSFATMKLDALRLESQPTTTQPHGGTTAVVAGLTEGDSPSDADGPRPTKRLRDDIGPSSSVGTKGSARRMKSTPNLRPPPQQSGRTKPISQQGAPKDTTGIPPGSRATPQAAAGPSSRRMLPTQPTRQRAEPARRPPAEDLRAGPLIREST